MEKFYGNYLGICISRMDPEKRGRVKIFIPEINPSLYEHWAKDGKNITINCVGDNIMNSLTAEIREKLEKILPYAEAAAPIFGSSAPGSFENSTGTYSQTADPGPQSPLANPDANAPSPSSSPLATPGGGIKPSNAMNGKMDRNNPQQLVPLGDYCIGAGKHQRYLNPFVEPHFKELCQAYQAEVGQVFSITDCYRSYEEQVKCAQEKGIYGQGGLCARPGNSNHGLGTAVDVGGKNSQKQQQWLFANASRFGFSTIAKGGPGSSESWHWEMKPVNLPKEAFAFTLANTGNKNTLNAGSSEVKPTQ